MACKSTISRGVIRYLLTLVPLAVFGAEPGLSNMPWPKRVCDFPAGDVISFTSGDYEVSHRIPDDPAIQAAGGSGGPIVKLTVRERKGGWHTSFTAQSVGERLLMPWHSRPQIEVWARGGGGSWTRELYRFTGAEYQSVRIDEFSHVPPRGKQKTATTTLPDAFHGKAPPDGDPTLYFVATRYLPNR